MNASEKQMILTGEEENKAKEQGPGCAEIFEKNDLKDVITGRKIEGTTENVVIPSEDGFIADGIGSGLSAKSGLDSVCRKDKRKLLKKLKRKQIRQQAALAVKAAEEARLADPSERAKLNLIEQQEAEALIREQAEHDRLEKLWLERVEQARREAELRQEEELTRKQEEEARKRTEEDELEEGWEYVEDGPAEIIWEGNEIIVKRPKKKVLKAVAGIDVVQKAERATTCNPLPPQGTAFATQHRTSGYEGAEQNRNFGTEQDKTHCPFHIKTGVCRFGVSCSRAHVYPDKSCTLLIRNMYTGPGLAWEHEDGLEYSEEEVYDHFEEFYDDVHEEFQKFGELVNFKVCRNGSSHLRGNVYAHYRTQEDALSAYGSINGRFYASKQISCEFVGVTRWRVAICGEYMKAHYRPCSRGTMCNFLHCFRNPRGEYSWADWDLPPPRSWQLMMNQLFGVRGDTNEGHHSEERDGSYEQDRHHQRSHKSNSDHRRDNSRGKLKFHRRNYSRSDGSSDDDKSGRPEISRHTDRFRDRGDSDEDLRSRSHYHYEGRYRFDNSRKSSNSESEDDMPRRPGSKRRRSRSYIESGQNSELDEGSHDSDWQDLRPRRTCDKGNRREDRHRGSEQAKRRHRRRERDTRNSSESNESDSDTAEESSRRAHVAVGRRKTSRRSSRADSDEEEVARRRSRSRRKTHSSKRSRHRGKIEDWPSVNSPRKGASDLDDRWQGSRI